MNEIYQQTFSMNLRYFMTLRKKTQADLVRDLHLGQSLVSKYWRGERVPRMATLDALCEYLNCSRSDLLGASPVSPPKSQTGDVLLDELLEIAAASPPGTVRMAINFLRDLNAFMISEDKKETPPEGAGDVSRKEP